MYFKVTGFHQGILKLAMEPSLLGTALMEGGPDRKIKLDRSPAADEVICFSCSSGKTVRVLTVYLGHLRISLCGKLSGCIASVF